MAENLDDSECSSEYCDSESCGSSCYSGSDDELQFFPWLEKVGSRGELFYIEPNFTHFSYQDACVINCDSESLYQANNQRKSKLNPAEKFKKWMKKRKRKVRKSFPLLKQNKYNNLGDNIFLDPLLSLPSRDVYIDVDSTKQTLGRRVMLCEELLGLELGLFEVTSHWPMENKIKVLGFVLGHDVADIKPGDWLMSINDITVNFHNLDEVLKGLSLPSRVKLTISSPYHKTALKSDNIPDHQDSGLEELLGSPDVIDEVKSQLLGIPHGIFYLVIEEDSIGNEGVVYRYPSEDTPLFQLKGMFITLSHMISDIASPPLLSCSISIQDELVHVSFVKEETGTFVLAFPGKCCTVSESQHFVTNLARLLKFQFSSLKAAFADENLKNQLDKFFTIFFKHYLSKYSRRKQMFESHLLDILPSVHWLPLPLDLKTEIEDILSELESSDFGSSSEGFDGNQRIYNILGSCLFYKGYLLCNHLPKSDLLDIHLFLHYNRILFLTKKQTVSEIIIWNEVFPSRHQEHNFSDPDFIEVQGRWFLLIVAMHHCVLSVILEAGGCALKADGYPPPEPFYVEEVQNTLIILHDCGITSAIEKIIHQCVPPVSPPHLFLKDKKNLFSSIFSNASSSSSLNTSSKGFAVPCNQNSAVLEKGQKFLEDISADKVDDPEAERQQLLFAMGPADGESDVDSSYSDISNENMYMRQSSRSYSFSTGSTTESLGSGEFSNVQGQTFKRAMSNNSDLNTLHLSYDNSFQENTPHVVAGFENTLFQYLHMDPVEGVFLAPVHDISILHESMLKDIWDNFYRCCLNLRTVFARSLRNEEIIKSSAVTKYGVNSFLRNAYEQGVLFRYTPKDNAKQKNSMTFWVIGRLFFTPEPRELYVCFQDSAHQDIVEIAFRLGFGLSL
ncbi:protein inturned-like isoform X3 [Argiope bruennichi]|uniref:protein inturned-like isoform X3 n=1 Tax=Argiope bruennichi TaxID=94029 RepID=UPI002494E879|nr:protein inturned-like isoform X3 [Argiope bruennichi]